MWSKKFLPVIIGLMLSTGTPARSADEAGASDGGAAPAAQVATAAPAAPAAEKAPAEGKAAANSPASDAPVIPKALGVGSLFSDNAVLQQKKPIAVWGTDVPGRSVFVSLLNARATTKADKDGNWSITLPPQKVGGPYVLTIKDAKKQVIANNVFIGEVWLCSGQSNMSLPIGYAKDSKDDIDSSTNPNLHLFGVTDRLSQDPITTYEGSWQLAQPKSVRDFSAVAYYFGRRLQEELNCPVGIIWSSYAGTPIKVWMGTEALENTHENTQVVLPANFVGIHAQWQKDVAAWEEKVADCRAKGLEEPAKPVLPSDFYAVSSAFNAMINPLIPYTIRGVAWYQGESDTDQPGKYHKMFGCMLDDWRKRWNDPTLPFVYNQLPAFSTLATKPTESMWADLREQQLMCRRIPYTYMVESIDVCAPTGIKKETDGIMVMPDFNPAHGKFNNIDLHPREKKPVGTRLGNAALSAVYKKPIAYTGPIYDSMSIEGNKIRINFRYAEGGLISKDPEVKGFQIAGIDKKWVLADAKIDGETVLVWNAQVQNPVAVRYAWAAYPNVSIFNKAELPAAPFRTDKWIHVWSSKNAKL
ncbi:MAG TPA: sialate O-acetylesterase [Planktothrix sp.]